MVMVCDVPSAGGEELVLHSCVLNGRDEVVCEVLEEEREAVVGLNAAGGGDQIEGAAWRRGSFRSAAWQWSHSRICGWCHRADAIERGPIDPVGFGRIERLEPGGVLDIEGEGGAGEVEIGQVLEARVFVEVIGVPKDSDGEIGGIAEDSAHLEAVGGGGVEGGGCAEGIEAAQGHGAVGLKFVDLFAHDPDWRIAGGGAKSDRENAQVVQSAQNFCG